MGIISLSLSEDVVRQLDGLQKDRGFSGRSETVRAAIRLLTDEQQQRHKLHGTLSAVLLVTHDERHAEELAAVRHKHMRSVRTQLHDHLGEKCMDLLVLRGDAKELVKLAEECAAIKGASAKLIPI